MSDVLVTDFETGESTVRPMTQAEESALTDVRVAGTLKAQAEALDLARRDQRQALYQQVQDIATPSWAQISDALTEARAAIARPTAQWTNVLVIDGVKLALRMGVFLVARELRRVYQNREPD